MSIKSIFVTCFFMAVFIFSGCGPRQFTKGRYDKNVEKTNLLTDQWSETDMQKAIGYLVKNLTQHPSISGNARPPIVLITELQNRTSEHIDTQSIMDMARIKLMNTKKVRFVDGQARDAIEKEYAYQDSGIVRPDTQKRRGGQIAPDFIINGRLDSIVQEAGARKTVYYKITLNLTNLTSGIIVWSDHKQIRKRFRKKRVGF